MIAEFPARQWKQCTFLRTKEHMNNSFLVTMSTSTNKHRYNKKLNCHRETARHLRHTWRETDRRMDRKP